MSNPITILLPPDVEEILQSIDVSPERAIIQLTRSYGSTMADAGLEVTPAEGYKPSLDAMRRDTDGWKTGARAAPLDPADGLVDWHYILGSGVGIAMEVAASETLTDPEYAHRKQVIRTTLSNLPEEAWDKEETRIAIESLF